MPAPAELTGHVGPNQVSLLPNPAGDYGRASGPGATRTAPIIVQKITS